MITNIHKHFGLMLLLELDWSPCLCGGRSDGYRCP